MRLWSKITQCNDFLKHLYYYCGPIHRLVFEKSKLFTGFGKSFRTGSEQRRSEKNDRETSTNLTAILFLFCTFYKFSNGHQHGFLSSSGKENPAIREIWGCILALFCQLYQFSAKFSAKFTKHFSILKIVTIWWWSKAFYVSIWSSRCNCFCQKVISRKFSKKIPETR